MDFGLSREELKCSSLAPWAISTIRNMGDQCNPGQLYFRVFSSSFQELYSYKKLLWTVPHFNHITINFGYNVK
jgi:hypothetical protein